MVIAKLGLARELIMIENINCELNLYVSRHGLSHCTKINHISASIRKSAKRGHCTRAEQGISP